MLRSLTILSVICMTVASASAQERVPLVSPGFVPPSSSDVRVGGITEEGRGVVTVAADRLRITVRAFGGNTSGTPVSNDVEKHVVDAMRANGIPDARLVPSVLGSLNSPDEFVGTIEKPTREKVAAIEQKIVEVLPTTVLPLLRNVNVNGALEADSCDSAIDRARSLAYADARKRAEALATIAGLHLGALTSANENDQTGGCSGSVGMQYYNNGNDIGTLSSIDLSVNLNATFATHP